MPGKTDVLYFRFCDSSLIPEKCKFKVKYNFFLAVWHVSFCLQELCVVFRDQPVEGLHTPANPNLPALALQQHLENFVNTVGFHMWAGLSK